MSTSRSMAASVPRPSPGPREPARTCSSPAARCSAIRTASNTRWPSSAGAPRRPSVRDRRQAHRQAAVGVTRARHAASLLVAASALRACSGGGGGAPEPDREAFCAHLTRAATMTLAFDQLDLASLQALVPELEDAVAVAPLEIRTDVG